MTTHHGLPDHRLQESFDVIHKAFGAVGVTTIEKLHRHPMALESDASSRQCYSKRRTEKLKTPDAQTVAVEVLRQAFPGFRRNPKLVLGPKNSVLKSTVPALSQPAV